MIKSWLRASRTAPEFRRMLPATYFRHFHGVVSSILDSPAVVARAVVAADRPAELYSFAVAELEPQVLHMVYTAGWCRRHRFAQAAAEACGLDLAAPIGFTFPTLMTGRLLRGDAWPLVTYVGAAALWRYEAA